MRSIVQTSQFKADLKKIERLENMIKTTFFPSSISWQIKNLFTPNIEIMISAENGNTIENAILNRIGC